HHLGGVLHRLHGLRLLQLPAHGAPRPSDGDGHRHRPGRRLPAHAAAAAADRPQGAMVCVTAQRGAWLAAALAATGQAGALELEGRLDADLRAFKPAEHRELTVALAGTLQAYHGFEALPLRFEAELFYRQDADDDQRSGGDIRQAFLE